LSVPTGVAALDRLSDRLLAAAAPLRLAVATTRAEREATYRLRYEQVMRHGGAAPGALREGMEQDAFDAEALHVGAWSADALVGAVRIVLPVPSRRLPVEAAFELDVEPRGAVVEVGRLVIGPAYRGDPAHRAWGALFAGAWRATRARGFTVLAGAASPRMIERLRGLGLPFEVLGPARPHCGSVRHPVRLDPAGGRPRWFEG
jgi:putative hemolysin